MAGIGRVYEMGGLRVVDLSKWIYPERSARPCNLRRFKQEDTQDYHTMIEGMESHLGTHVETPYHLTDDGADILHTPVTQFMGRGVRLMLDVGPNDLINTAAYTNAASAIGIRRDDIVILDSPWHSPPFEPRAEDYRPRLTQALAEACAADHIKALGFGEGINIESDNVTSLVIHQTLFEQNILLIEVIEGLQCLKDDVFFFCAQPMPIAGLDSCCVRAFAIEGLPGFTAGD